MKIYFVLTYTGTILAKIIKFYTRNEFSHVSISLDKDLKYMYSFGRLNPYNPFIGGFVHEYINKGTFKRFINTKARIIEIDIDESKYYKLQEVIKQMEINKSIYKFNIVGLFAVAFNLKIKAKNSFYCAEFIKDVTEKAGIDLNLPELIKPNNFEHIHKGKDIYVGLLRDYNK